MSKEQIMNLPADYALVLQQIKEDGEDDISFLSQELNLNRNRLSHIIKSLQRKGLILVNTNYDEVFVELSRKGQRMVQYIWPEVRSAL